MILAYISPEVLPSPCACACLCPPHYLGDVVVHMSPVMSLLYWNSLITQDLRLILYYKTAYTDERTNYTKAKTKLNWTQPKPLTRQFRAVFKSLSKLITWLWLLRFVIGSKDSRQFFNQWEAKPKPIAPCTRDFSRASSELQVIARNCDWLIALPAPVVIGRGNCFGFGFSTVIWKPLYTS